MANGRRKQPPPTDAVFGSRSLLGSRSFFLPTPVGQSSLPSLSSFSPADPWQGIRTQEKGLANLSKELEKLVQAFSSVDFEKDAEPKIVGKEDGKKAKVNNTKVSGVEYHRYSGVLITGTI